MLTSFQKEQVSMMRAQGLGYRKIANELGIQRDSVRNYCNSEKKSKTREIAGNTENNKEVCLWCNAPLIQSGIGRKKQFCNDRCRYQWQRKRAEEHAGSTEAFYERSCKCCGKEFTVYGNRKRVYCSRQCYISHRFWNGKKSVQSHDLNMETAIPTVILIA